MMDEFKKELRELLKKHNVSLTQWDEYGSDERHLGYLYEFSNFENHWSVAIDKDFINELDH